jgi:hypothetical protein
MDDDLEAVREELRDGVLALEEARVKSELSALERQELSDEVRRRIPALTRRLNELKHQRSSAGLAKP